MPRDIFTMREVARELDVRNQVIAPDPPRELTPIERAAFYPPGRYTLGRYTLGMFMRGMLCAVCALPLTAWDRGGICHQCRLDYAGQDA